MNVVSSEPKCSTFSAGDCIPDADKVITSLSGLDEKTCQLFCNETLGCEFYQWERKKWHWWHQQLRSARRRLQTKLLRLRSRYGNYDFIVKAILTFDLFITILCILSYHLTCDFFIFVGCRFSYLHSKTRHHKYLWRVYPSGLQLRFGRGFFGSKTRNYCRCQPLSSALWHIHQQFGMQILGI